MTLTPPEGTYYSLPPASAQRLEVAARLRRLYDAWGYAPVDVPVLERYDPAHPAAERSFKLSDRGAEVLALRADFTPAIAGLVGLHYPEAAGRAPVPKRFQYCGKLWQALDSDMARTREYTQVGLELVGVS
ncbi:MAG TPA: ATP phosphoribosyltransferase regulatory subunit, partial [Trueperaceae bacterium]